MTANDTRKLYQTVAQRIAEAIQNGRYLPGQKLPSERELTDLYNVSRPTIREAMIALEIRGLVEARHNAGVFVAAALPPPSDPADLDIGAFGLAEARKLVEGETAALAARTITDEEVATLYDLLDRIGRDFDRDRLDESADRSFHLTIAKATRNAALLHVVETLWDLRQKAPLTREIFRRARAIGISPFVDDHKAIVDALAARNPEAARRAMQAHLTNVMEELLLTTEVEAVEKAREEISRQRREWLGRTED